MRKDKNAHPYHETEKVYTLSLMKGELYGLSDLGIHEIASITALLTLNQVYETEIIPQLVTNYVKLKVSKGREGRKEILKIGGAKTSNILQLFTRKKTPVVSEEGYGEQLE